MNANALPDAECLSLRPGSGQVLSQPTDLSLQALLFLPGSLQQGLQPGSFLQGFGLQGLIAFMPMMPEPADLTAGRRHTPQHMLQP